MERGRWNGSASEVHLPISYTWWLSQPVRWMQMRLGKHLHTNICVFTHGQIVPLIVLLMPSQSSRHSRQEELRRRGPLVVESAVEPEVESAQDNDLTWREELAWKLLIGEFRLLYYSLRMLTKSVKRGECCLLENSWTRILSLLSFALKRTIVV